MATSFEMRNPQNGLTKTGFRGFSWTTLFFGAFPALFRADFLTFMGGFTITVMLGFMIGPFAWITFIVWSFFYNDYYTNRLIERGYRPVSELDAQAASSQGAAALTRDSQVASSAVSIAPPPAKRDLSDDAYKIYLTKKYPVSYNQLLGKHEFQSKLYASVDEVLQAMHEIEESAVARLRTMADIERLSESDAKIVLERAGYTVDPKGSTGYVAVRGGSTAYLHSGSDLVQMARDILRREFGLQVG